MRQGPAPTAGRALLTRALLLAVASWCAGFVPPLSHAASRRDLPVSVSSGRASCTLFGSTLRATASRRSPAPLACSPAEGGRATVEEAAAEEDEEDQAYEAEQSEEEATGILWNRVRRRARRVEDVEDVGPLLEGVARDIENVVALRRRRLNVKLGGLIDKLREEVRDATQCSWAHALRSRAPPMPRRPCPPHPPAHPLAAGGWRRYEYGCVLGYDNPGK